MIQLLTAKQMKALERAVIERGLAGLDLMERAGRRVVAAICETWPALADQKPSVLVLRGPGNNGGDGFVIARLLRELH